MARRLSPQTLSVLDALAAAPDEWRHGYDVAKATGLKSGSLYPILIRLQERGLLEARWEDETPEGRPRRHLYKLTAAGAAARRPQPRAAGRRRLAGGTA